MAWTFNQIRSDWLGPSQIACSPKTVVDAFNRSERYLGRDWIEQSRSRPSGIPSRGSIPTLHVIQMGQKLATLEEVAETESLIERLRRGDESAQAEATAIYLLRSYGTTSAQLFPKVLIDNKERVPDFRIRQPGGPWTYVEVTQANVSQSQERVLVILHRLINRVESIRRPFTLEIFLRREPTDPEVAQIEQEVSRVCLCEGVLSQELPDGMGLLLLNHDRPGQVIVKDHPGEEKVPRLSAAKRIMGPQQPDRHLMVRMPFADKRAEAFLKDEAKQLPKDAPGLVMVQVARAPGAFKSWEPLLRRRFQPTVHTRVGGVCLFSGGLVPTEEGEAWLPQTKLLVNSHAAVILPAWIPDALREAGAEYEKQTLPG